MFQKTDHPYSFQYLITGITGEGISEVFLPPPPIDKEVLFEKEQKFTRPEMPSQLKKWAKEWLIEKETDKNFIHAKAEQIVAWEDQEWKRSSEGIYFWSNGVRTYITPFYYWYLTSWRTYFGYPIFRETDKELTYFIQYCEEDPDCYGGLINTIRRYGKSSIFGAWITYRTLRERNHSSGMQGEKEKKVKKFFNKMIVKPFLKLPYYYQPKFDTSSTHQSEIKFDVLPERAKKRKIEVDEDQEPLESVIDFRSSGPEEYDGDVLNSYIMEEPGKCLEASIYSEDGDGTWDIVKPCLRKGRQIRGKAMMGTTVEFMNVADKGGQAYRELFYDSDFNQRQLDGRTKSGLYAAFLPGDTAYEDFLDEWGHPMREKARQSIVDERESFKDRPAKKAGAIRRYPLSIKEIFYINPSSCAFSSPDVLQDRLIEIDTTVGSLWETFDLSWENNIPFTKVIWRHNKQNGWLRANFWPEFEKSNKVERIFTHGKWIYRPTDDEHWAMGFDPIQHRTVEGKTNRRESRPVASVKRKYDPNIDGFMDDAIMQQRAKDKFKYQTNKYVAIMDKRPNDPNILFERLLMMCWYLGCSVHIEKQKDAVISYFHEKNCGDFVLAKYTHDYEGPPPLLDGTASTPRLIEDYTNALDHYITNYGHTIPFRELVEDLLLFKPNKTTEHDYTVSAGFTELACKMKPKNVNVPVKDFSDFMPIYDQFGNAIA